MATHLSRDAAEATTIRYRVVPKSTLRRRTRLSLEESERTERLARPHHAAWFEIPDEWIGWLEPESLAAWEVRESSPALAFGTKWLAERRSVALVVPAVPSRPVGRSVMINPAHPDAGRIVVSERFPVPWDERLFQ